mgnify:CR=1 FL=1
MTNTKSLITFLFEVVDVDKLKQEREVEFNYNNRDIRIQYFNDNMRITDVTNAKKRGKKCIQLEVRAFNNEDIDIMQYMYITNIATIETFFDNFSISEIGYFLQGIIHSKYVYSVWVAPSKEITPAEFNLKNIYKPIKTLKVSHNSINIYDIIRILVNNNVKVIQDGRYTDDYAWDAETNYNKGYEFNPIKFAKELIKCKRGWHAYLDRENKNRISICCYSFDNRSIYLEEPIKIA